jgi:exoribonuclease R
MLALSRHNWLAGTLELSSKVRYGLTSRGVPKFRFVPYDRRFKPIAVGCSSRDLFYNVHAIVEPSEDGTSGILVQNLGRPTLQTEEQILLATYAYDSQKSLRKWPPAQTSPRSAHPAPPLTERQELGGYTFHIDPEGCKDVDDTITFLNNPGQQRQVAINIADVDAWIPEGSPLDTLAAQKATTFYSPRGKALAPMLPPDLSEGSASLAPDSTLKPTVSLLFQWTPGSQPTDLRWALTATRTNESFTYEQATDQSSETMKLLEALANDINPKAGKDSHEWISTLMVFYNIQAAKILRQRGEGILRRSKLSDGKPSSEITQALLEKYPELQALFFEAAEFCEATEEVTAHKGLQEEVYTYATSPLRRYADLVNQRILKAHIQNIHPPTTPSNTIAQLVQILNQRQKQEKAFQKDLFFATVLTAPPATNDRPPSVTGIVLAQATHETKGVIYVPEWKRKIRVRGSLLSTFPEVGSKVAIQWYEDQGQVQWKNKTVFQIVSTGTSE